MVEDWDMQRLAAMTAPNSDGALPAPLGHSQLVPEPGDSLAVHVALRTALIAVFARLEQDPDVSARWATFRAEVVRTDDGRLWARAEVFCDIPREVMDRMLAEGVG